MSKFTRRNFVKVAGLATAAGVAGFPMVGTASSTTKVLVIGGGYGGAIAAKYTRLMGSNIQVTLIEKNKDYYSCAFSNEVISGHHELDSVKFGYDGLAAHGVKVIIDKATDINPATKTVSTSANGKISYDMLVVSPGVVFKDVIEGYDEAAYDLMPHAWKAGPQTLLLRDQIRAMKDGGTVMISAPPNPFRCPPGPYERAAQIAYYLKQHKPKSKIIVMDWKDKFSKQGLFTQGWEKHYPGMIEWRKAADDGKIVEVDAKKGIVITEFDEHTPDVANIIPAQKAGHIAHLAGLADDSGFCPVNQATFESTIHKDIYVIGDSCIAGKMPKSGYAANSQGKMVAAAIVSKVSGKKLPDPSYVNTCYSLITPDHGISVAAVYKLVDGKIVGVKGAGGLSPIDASDAQRKTESIYARSWFRNIMGDTFG